MLKFLSGWRDAEREAAATIIEDHGRAAYGYCRDRIVEAMQRRDEKAQKRWHAIKMQVRRQLGLPAPGTKPEWGDDTARK